VCSWNKFQLEDRGQAHGPHGDCVRKPLGHLGLAVGPLHVVHGQINDLQIQLCGAEQQFIVAPPVLDTPVALKPLESQMITAPERLGATERVLDALANQKGKRPAETGVTQDDQPGHRLALLKISDPRAVNEFP